MPPVRARAAATVRDVAQAAGVSIATVSRALAQPAIVRPATRARIERAAAKLNYVSDGLARALSTGRTRTVGAVIPTLDNAIYSVSTHSLQRTLEQAGYTLLVACHEFDLAAEARMVRAFAERGVDGLVLVGRQHDPAARRLVAAKAIPCVVTWALDDPRRGPSVGFDNRAAGRLVAAHLADLGHRRIGMISGRLAGNDRAADRLEGVRAELARRRLALPERAVVEADYSLASGAQALEVLLARVPVSAVICGNDVLAIGALQAAQRVGRRVPGDLSVAGFDDMPFARVVSPPLTTVRFPIEDVGSHAARYLLARLAGGTPARRIELPIELVVRASTGRARRDA